jgi:hypothetical protein
MLLIAKEGEHPARYFYEPQGLLDWLTSRSGALSASKSCTPSGIRRVHLNEPSLSVPQT